MKKTFKVLAFVLSIIFLMVLVVLTHAGLFQPVVAVEKEVGPYTMVYQEYRGPYHQVKAEMDEVYDGLERLGIPTYQGIGLYYDNPQQVQARQLRSEVGSVLEEKDWSEIERIEQEFAVKTIPAQAAVVAELPIRNPLSYLIGPQKVYRQIEAVWQDQGYDEPAYSVEIYDEVQRKIIYIMPIPGTELTTEAESANEPAQILLKEET